MNLSRKLNLIFSIAILTAIAIVYLTFHLLGAANQKQLIGAGTLQIEALLNSQLSFITQDFVNDRFYAATIRGRSLTSQKGADGIEIGFYRSDGSTLFESAQISKIVQVQKRRGKIAPEQLVPLLDRVYILIRRPVQFAGDTLGEVYFAKEMDSKIGRSLTNGLYASLIALAAAFTLLFAAIKIALTRSIVSPINKLNAAIPKIGLYLNNQLEKLELPHNMGSSELNLIVQTLADVAVKLKVIINDQKAIQIKKERETAIVEVAQQVAHDIGSPLAALDVALEDLDGTHENTRVLIRGAVSRIRDIANNLIRNSTHRSAENDERKTKEPISIQLLSNLIDSVISEKRTQYRHKIDLLIDFGIDQNAYGIFAMIQPIEFKRMLSNLLNNAIEASRDRGFVKVLIHTQADKAVITLKDSGVGISPEILPRLGKRGESHGKELGLGLGLFHASSSVEFWNGTLKIESTLGEGTAIRIDLPIAEPPPWFVPELKIADEDSIVILDDDPMIHRIWDSRFATLKDSNPVFKMSIIHFSRPEEVTEWISAQTNSVLNKTLYLFDYELIGYSETGLDLIESLGIATKSILITSRFEDHEIRETCGRIGVRLIPKRLAGFVPVKMVNLENSCIRSIEEHLSPDLVLIDDDRLIQMLWKDRAKFRNKKLMIFEDAKAFLAVSISRETPIFIDYRLANGISGLTVAAKLNAKGYSQLFIATGYHEIPDIPSYIKSVVGKSFPV